MNKYYRDSVDLATKQRKLLLEALVNLVAAADYFESYRDEGNKVLLDAIDNAREVIRREQEL
jgi:hypothetical protein